MLKPQYIAAASAAAFALAACGSDPVSYSEPRYVSSAGYSAANDSSDYGRVVAIDVVRGGRTSGGGAIVGGIVGGVLGHQVGSGRGNDAATVAGAVGGAVVGNEIEKRRNDEERYRVTVRMRDGREATFEQDSTNGLRVGDRVRVDGGRIIAG